MPADETIEHPAGTSPGPPSGRLYTSGQVAYATFLGAPIAGCWLLAANYRALGNAPAAKRALIAGALATVGIFTLAFFLPDNFPNTVLPIAYTFGLHAYAKQLQGTALAAHFSAGGLRHTHGRAVGIALVFLVLTLVLLFSVVMILPQQGGEAPARAV